MIEKAKVLKLVDDYGNACLKAGQLNSGFCIDPYAPYAMETVHKLRQELIEEIVALYERK